MTDCFKPQRSLRSTIIKNTLKTFLVSPIAKKYHVCAVRTLWKKEISLDHIWRKRKEMELLLSRKEKIVAVFSCITALEQSKKSKKRKKNKQQQHESEDESSEDTEEAEIHPGISFWIAFD